MIPACASGSPRPSTRAAATACARSSRVTHVGANDDIPDRAPAVASSFPGELPLQPVDIQQGLVHHPLPCTQLSQRDSGVGTIAPFRGGLDGGEIHPVAVAIA